MFSPTLGSSGHIYALVTGAHSFIKIGYTTLDPHERARQLSAATASPTPFYVAYTRFHNNASAAEAAVHEILDEYRVNDSREFFSCSLQQAVNAIDRICGCLHASSPATPYANLFASFPDDSGGRELTEEEREKCRDLARTLERVECMGSIR